MKCYTEEIFGPVLVTLNVDTLDEVCTIIDFTFKYDYYYLSGN